MFVHFIRTCMLYYSIKLENRLCSIFVERKQRYENGLGGEGVGVRYFHRYWCVHDDNENETIFDTVSPFGMENTRLIVIVRLLFNTI